MTAYEPEGTFCCDGNVLELYLGNGCITINLLKNNRILYFKMVNFRVCKLYLHKVVLKRYMLYQSELNEERQNK